MREALDLLGYRTYHMSVLQMKEFNNHFHLWEKLADTQVSSERKALLKQIFDNSPYTAAVDFPACIYWRELSEIYPEAKVILTVRDEKKWAESVRDTIAFWASLEIDLSEAWYGSIVKTFQFSFYQRVRTWHTKWWFSYFEGKIDFRTEEGRQKGSEKVSSY